MVRKIRRSIDDIVVALRNFVTWLPNSIKNIREEFPSSLRRFRFWFTSFRGGLTSVCFVILILIPFLTGSEYYTHILIVSMIFAIFAASWDLLAGYAGQVSFGHSVFFGLAGYFSAAFIKFIGFHWIPALFIGVFASA